MPKFCRHNRLLQNCPICAREQAVEMRPLVSSSAPRVAEPRPAAPRPPARRQPAEPARGRGGVRIRRLRSTVDDGYRSPLVPGLKSSQEAARLAEEIAFAATRLRRLATDPPGLYAEVAGLASRPRPAGPEGETASELEERTWLAFLIAYLYPLEAADPFAAIRRLRTDWAKAEKLSLAGAETGPRTSLDPDRWPATIGAYRAWAGRAGSQARAFGGEPDWTPERRFSRLFERLALPGLSRALRFELLTSLGALGVYELRAASLALGGGDEVTVAAKRALGIGDPLLLERRAAQLAEACQAPLAALDLALHSWERGERVTGGLGPGAEPGEAELAAARLALEL